MVLVFAHKKTDRLFYVLDFILSENFGLNYKVVTNSEEFNRYEGEKINYSMEYFDNCIQIFPRLLLFQDDISEHRITVYDWENTKMFYKVDKGDFAFDIFAATFFLITRYEEYLYAKRDKLGRYDPRNSLAWRNNFLYEPVVNIWLIKFADLLIAKYPNIEIRKNKYKFQPTIDIDNAYAFLHKGFYRTIGGIVSNMTIQKFKNFSCRMKVLLNIEKDPYDTYDKLNEIHSRYNLNPIFFFLMGNYGGYDHALSFKNQHFQKLINNYSVKYDIGVHPSFAASQNEFYFVDELEQISEIAKAKVRKSRYHFINIKFPESYNNLIAHDITDDYSLGYPSRNGFRAGYAGSFYFFDLSRNKPTNLRIHTFQLMDATLQYYNKLNPEQAYDKACEIIDKIKKVNGTLTTIWHNESLGNVKPWVGWSNVYERIVKYAVPDNE